MGLEKEAEVSTTEGLPKKSHHRRFLMTWRFSGHSLLSVPPLEEQRRETQRLRPRQPQLSDSSGVEYSICWVLGQKPGTLGLDLGG